MIKKNVYPQEIVVWYILPLIRRELAIELKKSGLDQKRISSILGLTEAAISQYFNQKRGNKLKINRVIHKEVEISAKNILKNENKVIFEVQRLLSLPEIKPSICSIHKNDFGAKKICNLCQIGDK